MVEGLVLLRIVFAPGRLAVVSQIAVYPVLRKAEGNARIVVAELANKAGIVPHLAVIPAIIEVIADAVRDEIKLAVVLDAVEVSRRGQAGGVELLCQAVELCDLVVHLQALTHHGDLVLDTPETDGGVVPVLQDQLSELAFCVLEHTVVGVRHGQHGDLGPDHKAFFVTQVIEILRVLVVRKAHCIGPQLLEDGHVLIQLSTGEGAAHSLAVLVLSDAVQPQMLAVEGEALRRVHLD